MNKAVAALSLITLVVGAGSAFGIYTLYNDVQNLEQRITGESKQLEDLVDDLLREELTGLIDHYGVVSTARTDLTITTEDQLIPGMEFSFSLEERSLVLILYSISIDFQESQIDNFTPMFISVRVRYHWATAIRRMQEGGDFITGYALEVLPAGNYNAEMIMHVQGPQGIPVEITILQSKLSIITFSLRNEE